jgi:hypothetical protein
MEPIPFTRGRKANARPRFLFRDSGYEVEMHKMGPATLSQVAEAIRAECAKLPDGHEHKLPEPPLETIEIGGETRTERNERHPDYLKRLDKWSQWASQEINSRLLRIAAVAYVDPIDTTPEDIHQEAARMRRILKAEGIELPFFEQYDLEENDRIIWLMHVAASTAEDLKEFYAALTQRSAVSEEAVQAHISTFPTG